ncbi:hypothetical protein SCUCBS95973_005678 [Sporothrix curviconia]|uniref:F-box domain-containing protein n=1 Tax=Sporothrix curviconia TaxID=1260050 RepID=A0ABP0BYU7_9PEZI
MAAMLTDAEMPLGRLAALCPEGPIREPPPGDIIKALLAKYSNKSQKHGRRGGGGSFNAVSVHNDIDILAAQALYNDAYSPLCRLPDELLICIMEMLDFDDILCLRQTTLAAGSIPANTAAMAASGLLLATTTGTCTATAAVQTIPPRSSLRHRESPAP